MLSELLLKILSNVGMRTYERFYPKITYEHQHIIPVKTYLRFLNCDIANYAVMSSKCIFQNFNLKKVFVGMINDTLYNTYEDMKNSITCLVFLYQLT